MSSSREEMDSRTGNLLLDALPLKERKGLVGTMRAQTLKRRQIVAEPARAMTSVYFPVGAVLSLMTVMSDGSAMEMAMVGPEGVVGIPVFLGDSTAGNVRAVTQVAGVALSVGAEEFEREADASPSLTATLHGYTNALLIEAAQEAGCARLHSLRQRLSRLLIMTQDRAGTARFPLTQEFMSEMLGVHRPSVSLAARALHDEGLIDYNRGNMVILHRDALAATACECYAVIRSAIERLIRAPLTPSSGRSPN